MSTNAETPPAKRPRGRPPGTTKLAMAMRHPGANLAIDHPLNQDPTPAPRRGPGRPRGSTKAAMLARPPVVPKPRKDGRGGARPGAGRPRKAAAR
jgi:hypothetical protein